MLLLLEAMQCQNEWCSYATANTDAKANADFTATADTMDNAEALAVMNVLANAR